jgi:lipopolysaccharide transport system permease protein
MLGNLKSSFGDLIETQRRFRLVHILGWQDLKARYKRSLLGPFWLTLSTGVLIGSISWIMSAVSKIQLSDFLPYVTAGFIFWSKATAVITESCLAFNSSESMIKQVQAPLFVYFERVIWRNILMLAHDILLFPVALLIVWRPLELEALYFIPGFLLFLLNVGWAGLLLGILSTRYRDLPMTVTSMLPILFYFTPIIWKPESMRGTFIETIIQWNPFYYLMQLVRGPLMGDVPSIATWGGGMVVAAVGWAMALVIYARARDRVVFWL